MFRVIPLIQEYTRMQLELIVSEALHNIKNYLISLSRYLTNLMHKICFTLSFISCLYMLRAHVLIIRRSKLHYTASGIITPI